MHHDLPGLMEWDVNVLLQRLPNNRGILRVARYEEQGGTKTVIYELLDEHGRQVVDDQGRTVDIHTEYPVREAENPVGTEFRIG